MSNAIRFKKGLFHDPRIVLFEKVEIGVGKSCYWGLEATYYHADLTFTIMLIKWYFWITVYHKNLDWNF